MKKNINIAVVIGPEGGFAESEIENLTNIGCKIITLGKKNFKNRNSSTCYDKYNII